MTYIPSKFPPATEKVLEGTLGSGITGTWTAPALTVSTNTLNASAGATAIITPNKTGYYSVAMRWRGTWGAQPDRTLGLYARLLVNGVQQDADDADAGGGANGTSTEVSLIWHGLVQAGQAITIEMYKGTQDLSYRDSKLAVEFVPVKDHPQV